MKKTMHLIVLLFAGVFGVDTDEAKMMSVMEGDSVTLNPCVKKNIQKEDKIRWKFGATRVAEKEMDKEPTVGITLYDGDDGIFRKRLHVDPQTGSLTIKNIRTNHSGLYEAELTYKDKTIRKLFNVTVIGVFDLHSYQLKSVSVMEGTSVQLKTNVTVKKNDLMLWKFGNAPKQCSYNSIHHYPCLSDLTDIAKLDRETQEISLDSGENQLFTDNLSLDKQTGDLTIRNTRTQHTGYYVLQISGNNENRYRGFSVTVSRTESQQCLQNTLTIVSHVFALSFPVAVAVAVALICYYKKRASSLTTSDGAAAGQQLVPKSTDPVSSMSD